MVAPVSIIFFTLFAFLWLEMGLWTPLGGSINFNIRIDKLSADTGSFLFRFE